jgi:hypothetical protein
LNGTNQFLDGADDVNLLGKNLNIIKKNTEAQLHASKKDGQEDNTDTSEYMFLSHGQTVGQNHYIKVAIKSFENVAEFKYLGTTVTNQNCITKKLGADLTQGMLATMQLRIFCLPGCYL